MVQAYSKVTQNGNKCPHGLPVGTCPICNGSMGGGAKRKQNTPIKHEMTYGECLLEWHRIQARKQDKLDALNDKLEYQEGLKEKQLLQRIEKVIGEIKQLEQKVVNFLDKISFLPKTITNIVKNVINIASNLIQSALNNIQQFLNNVNKIINTINEKMMLVASSIFGEIQNFIEGFKTNKLTKQIKILLSLFNEKENSEEEENEEKVKEKKLKFKKIKEVFKGLFRIKNKQKGKKQDDEFI